MMLAGDAANITPKATGILMMLAGDAANITPQGKMKQDNISGAPVCFAHLICNPPSSCLVVDCGNEALGG